MSVNFSFDEKNISVILDETNLQINNLEQNVQVNLENQFKIEDLSDKTLVKILMLKGEKGDAGATTGASWGYITGNITDQTDLKNALNSKANKNELSTVATSGSYTDLSNKPTIPSKTSDLTNDSGFIDNSYHDNTKQDTLVSGTNIKTINNTSLLGSGNITIEGGGGTATDVQINGTSITSNDVANIVTEGTYNETTNKIATISDIPTNTSDLTNDSGFIDNTYHDSSKQDTLVSGTNIKTINNTSILGSGNISIGSGLTFDDIYPVGSVYMSVNSTNPATLFGGTWQRIKDKFLLASGDTYANGTTGGSADAVVVEHTHTMESSGEHNHGLKYSNNGGSGTARSVISSSGTNTSNGVITENGLHTHTINSNGENGTGKNMPPYLAVYMWQRTA